MHSQPAFWAAVCRLAVCNLIPELVMGAENGWGAATTPCAGTQTITLVRCLFEDGKAYRGAGATFDVVSLVQLLRVVFRNNAVTDNGGGAHFTDVDRVVMASTQFINNTAGEQDKKGRRHRQLSLSVLDFVCATGVIALEAGGKGQPRVKKGYKNPSENRRFCHKGCCCVSLPIHTALQHGSFDMPPHTVSPSPSPSTYRSPANIIMPAKMLMQPFTHSSCSIREWLQYTLWACCWRCC
jgi:hypothetical protein